GAHQLSPKYLSLGTQALGQAMPGFLHGWEELLTLEDSVIDPPGQTKAEKPCSARLGIGELFRVIEIHSPQAVGSLPLDQFRRLPAEDLQIALTAGVILGQVLQYSRDPGKHPTVTARPENLLSVGSSFPDESGVPVIQPGLLVKQRLRD